MSGNIAHFVIAKTALERLLEKDLENKYLKKINFYMPYFLLGSVGPDLPSYKVSSMLCSVARKKIAKLRNQYSWLPVKPDGYPYACHHINVNEMAAALFNVLLKDFQGQVQSEIDEVYYGSRIAFATGWLCHIATDRCIHPVVNKYAGNYYKSLENTAKHMYCEIIQDLWIYAKYIGNNSLKNYKKEDFRSYIGIKYEGLGKIIKLFHKFSYKELKGFISRAYFEAHSIFVKPFTIGTWLCGFNRVALSSMDDVGPVRSESKEFVIFENDELYEKLEETGCVGSEYEDAVEKAIDYCMYMLENAERFSEGDPLSGKRREEFLEFVGDYDLTNPPLNEVMFSK